MKAASTDDRILVVLGTAGHVGYHFCGTMRLCYSRPLHDVSRQGGGRRVGGVAMHLRTSATAGRLSSPLRPEDPALVDIGFVLAPHANRLVGRVSAGAMDSLTRSNYSGGRRA